MGVKSRSSKGVVELVAVLLVLALTAFTSASLYKISEQVTEAIGSSVSNADAYFSIQGNAITIYNPTPMATPLSSIKLIINGAQVVITDENGNGLWEPFEKITFTLPSDSDVLTITLYVKGKLVYDAIYVKPKIIQLDKNFPQIGLDVEPPRDKKDVGALKIRLDLSDDLSLATINAFVGDLSKKSESELYYKNILTGVEEWSTPKAKGKKSGHTGHEGWFTTTQKMVKHYTGNLMIPASNLKSLDIGYIRIVVKDVSGKTSSKIIAVKQYTQPVSVTVERPYNGERFVEGEKIPVTVVAKNALKLQVFLNDTLIADLNCSGVTCRFEKQLDPLSVGHYSIKAEAWNALYFDQDKVNFQVIKDNPPVVNITYPSDGAKYYTTGNNITITVKANASDDFGVEKVEFYVDGNKVCIDNEEPYECSVTLDIGNHTIRAVAYDSRNQEGNDSIKVSVVRDQPPTVTITYPTNGATVPPSFTIQANAEDDRGVAKVEFYIDGNKVCEDYSAPYTCDARNLASGSHEIRAIAFDTVGQTGSDSITVTVDAPPKVQILQPNNTLLSLTEFDVVVSAADDIGVTKVVVELDNKEYTAYEGVALKSVIVSVKATASIGMHTIRAIAYDTANQSTLTSKTVRIISPPVIKIINPTEGEIYNIGDPQITYLVSSSSVVNKTFVTVNKDKIMSTLSSLISNSTCLSTGWFEVLKSSEVYIPPLPNNKIKTIIYVKPALGYLPSIMSKPRIFRGEGDSFGTTFTVNTLTPVHLRIILTPKTGYAPVKKVGDSFSTYYWYVSYTVRAYKITLPEGARIEKCVYTQSFRYSDSRGFGIISTYIGFDKNIPTARWGYKPPATILSFPVQLPYYNRYKTITYELNPDVLSRYINKNYNLVVYNYETMSSFSSDPKILVKYITTVRNVKVYVDGKLVRYIRTTLSSAADALTLDVSLDPGEHTITIKSGNGAFRFACMMVPSQSSTPQTAKVMLTTPSGEIPLPVNKPTVVYLTPNTLVRINTNSNVLVKFDFILR